MQGYQINLYIGPNKVTTNYGKAIRHATTSPDIRKYYRRKHEWSDSTMHTMDWDAHGKAMKTFPSTQQKTLHQYIHGWLPTGDKMKQRHGILQRCPHCKQEETNQHIRQCQANTEQNKEFITTLKKKTTPLGNRNKHKKHTDPKTRK